MQLDVGVSTTEMKPAQGCKIIHRFTFLTSEAYFGDCLHESNFFDHRNCPYKMGLIGGVSEVQNWDGAYHWDVRFRNGKNLWQEQRE